MSVIDSGTERLTGKAFETILKQRIDQLRKHRQASIGRYGVQASVMDSGKTTVVMRSLPDFEGVITGMPQTIFDAKVCSQASFDLTPYRFETKGSKARQLRHLLERAEYGCITFFLIHWNPRHLKTRSDPAETWTFPVHHEMPFWRAFHAGEEKSIRREHCREYGVPVEWTTGDRERTPRPDVIGAVLGTYRLLTEYGPVV